jgi:hypothetical protein
MIGFLILLVLISVTVAVTAINRLRNASKKSTQEKLAELAADGAIALAPIVPSPGERNIRCPTPSSNADELAHDSSPISGGAALPVTPPSSCPPASTVTESTLPRNSASIPDDLEETVAELELQCESCLHINNFNGELCDNCGESLTEVRLKVRWNRARATNDLDPAIDILYEVVDSGDMPAWLDEERSKLYGDVAEQLHGKLDDADTRLGYQAIRLSGTGDESCILAFLGIASVCIQPGEQGGDVNPKLLSVLRSHREIINLLPKDSLPPIIFTLAEVATRRVEILVRLDHAQKVNALREKYIEAVQMTEMISVPEVVAPHRARVRSGMEVLQKARDDLAYWITLLEHEGERQIVAEDLQLLDDLINAGRHALGLTPTPRFAIELVPKPSLKRAEPPRM